MKTKMTKLLFIAGLMAGGTASLGDVEFQPRIKPLGEHNYAISRRGVGVGSAIPRDEGVDQLMREMGLNYSIDTSHGVVSDVMSWCRRAAHLISRERMKAQNLYVQRKYRQAIEVLTDVFKAVSMSMTKHYGVVGPMTKQMADRGWVLAHKIEQNLVGSYRNRSAAVSSLNFLFAYTDFLLDVESDFDRSWYIPYRYRHGQCRGENGGYSEHHCEGFKFKNFEKKYIELATRQLDFLNELVTPTFTNSADGDYIRVARPLGQPVVFLTASQFISHWVKHDISENLYGYDYACSVMDLNRISRDLRDFNHGDRRIFYNNRVAFNATYSTINHIIDDIDLDSSNCD